MFHLLIEVLNLQVLGLLQQPGQNASIFIAGCFLQEEWMQAL